MTIGFRGRRALVADAFGGTGAVTADALTAAGADVASPGRGALDITDEALVPAFLAGGAAFDHAVVAAAATRSGSAAAFAPTDAGGGHELQGLRGLSRPAPRPNHG